MINRTNEEITKFMEELFGGDVSINRITDEAEKIDKLEIEIEQMYEYVDCSFVKLMEVSKFFDTVNIDIDDWSSSGCPTCDYGSSYVKKLTIW